MKALEVLEKSEVFKKQSLLLELLRYLIEQEEKGVKLKSVVIAIDLIPENKSTRSTDKDTLIRTRLYNLRKKLSLFYLTEGKAEVYQLVIPKGGFAVDLIKKDIPSSASAWRSRPTILFAALSCILIIIILFLLNKNAHSLGEGLQKPVLFTGIKEHPLLHSMVDTSKPSVNIAVGERQYYYEYDTTLMRHRFILDSDCSLPHTQEKLNKLKDSFPERNIGLAGFSHVDPENAFLGLKLYYSLLNNSVQSQYTLSNKVSSVEKHTVFIGDLGAGDLNKLLSIYSFHNNKSKIKVGMKDDIRMIYVQDEKKQKTYPWDRLQNVSYYLIRKSVVNGKHYLFLFSGGIMSRSYMTKHLFTEAFSNEIKATFKVDIPDSFELIIAVKGRNGLGVSHQVLFAEAI